MKYYYIVAAAGVGKRMELSYPKQFLEYKSKPIYINVLEKLQENELVNGIIVVTNKTYTHTVEKTVENFGITKVLRVVEGGKERQDSVYNALKSIKEEDCIVAVQDGVRPFIEERYISETYNQLLENKDLDGLVVAVKVKDTIKRIDEDASIVESPKRAFLMAAQTPQVFRGKKLKEAYEKAKAENYYGTDDSSLVERIGGRVKIIEGSYKNIKITTKEDLIHLEN